MFQTLALAATLSLSNDGLVARPPAEVRMSADRLEMIDQAVRKGMNAGGYPGAAVIVGRKGAIVYDRGFGKLSWGVGSPAVTTRESIYDLASLTKVVATTTAAMILYDEGKLDLDAPVQRYVPDFVGARKNEATVRMLLAHRAGLAAGRELWRKATSPAEAREMVVTTRLAYRPGTRMLYSDLGADVLGWVVERAAGQPLDRFIAARVFKPLGMTSTGFRPAATLRDRIAPTDRMNGGINRGQVHDANAAALGGVAGHAGLFGTASDLAVFAQMMLNRGTYRGVRIVADSTVRLFTTPVADSRALGWAIAAGEHGAGVYLDEHAYGHTGFTGTSLWIDPDREMFVVLLTNRVHHPRVRRPARVIADVRQDVTDVAAMSVLDEEFAVAMVPPALRADIAEDWNRPYRRARPAPAKRASPAKTPARTATKATAKAPATTPGKSATAARAKATAKAPTKSPGKPAH